MHHQRIRILHPSSANGSRYCRRDAAADAAIGHHCHQHQHGKDERDARQRIRAEEAHEIGFSDADKGLHDQHKHRRSGEFHKHRDDRAIQRSGQRSGNGARYHSFRWPQPIEIRAGKALRTGGRHACIRLLHRGHRLLPLAAISIMRGSRSRLTLRERASRPFDVVWSRRLWARRAQTVAKRCCPAC